MLAEQLIDVPLLRERLEAMESLLLQHKIKPPKLPKIVELKAERETRINRRQLVAARALERLQTDGIDVQFSLERHFMRSRTPFKAVAYAFDLDLLECIAPYIDLKSLGALRQVSRSWRSTFYHGSIAKGVLSGTDYVPLAQVYAMFASVAGGEFYREAMHCQVDGIGVVRGADVLRLVQKHGISWVKVARRHSAETAVRLAFREVPIPAHVEGGRRRLEVGRCSTSL